MGNPFSFAGKVAIITGSTRGIGLATARVLAEQGASVVISSRKAEACEAVRDEFHAAGLRAIAVPANVGRPGANEEIVAAALREWGRIDMVVANAGINPSNDPLEVADFALWDKVMSTNVNAPLRLAQLTLAELARTGGSMVLVSSIAGLVGVGGAGAYGVSKAALLQLTRQLAAEWGKRGVRVNAVAPGTIRTDMIRALAAQDGYLEAIAARSVLGRLGEPEDIGNTIMFLLSHGARHITGQVIVVDGGEATASAMS